MRSAKSLTRCSALGGKASDRDEPATATPHSRLPDHDRGSDARAQTQRTDARRCRPGSLVVAVHSSGPAGTSHHPPRHSRRRAKSARPQASSAILVRRPPQAKEPYRQARIATTTRSGHPDSWLTPRQRLRTLQMAQHCAPPASPPDAARFAALRRDRLHVGVGRLRWRLLGPAPRDCWPTAPRRKRRRLPPSSAAGSDRSRPASFGKRRTRRRSPVR